MLLPIDAGLIENDEVGGGGDFRLKQPHRPADTEALPCVGKPAVSGQYDMVSGSSASGPRSLAMTRISFKRHRLPAEALGYLGRTGRASDPGEDVTRCGLNARWHD